MNCLPAFVKKEVYFLHRFIFSSIFVPVIRRDMKYLILHNNYFLLRVTAAQIVYVSSDGSYSILKLISGEEHTFSFNLATMERQMESQLDNEAHGFIRVGRGLIVNSAYIHSINLTHQELVLWNEHFTEPLVVKVPKEALRSLKYMIEDTIGTKEDE